MPKVSETYLQDRKDQILNAAAECFAQDGFHSTSMADIIRACGLSAGSVYRYYKSKDDLISAIIDRYLQMLVLAVIERNKATSEPVDLVMAAVMILEQQAEDGPPAIFLKLLPQFWAEAMRNDLIRQKAVQFYGLVEHNFIEIVRRAQAQGTLASSIDPQSIARIMISLIQGYLLQKLMLGIETDAKSYIKAITQLLHPENKKGLTRVNGF